MAERSEIWLARKQDQARLGLDVHALGRGIDQLRKVRTQFALLEHISKDARRMTAFAGIVEDIESLTVRATSLQRRLKAKRRDEKGAKA
ncbi:hypothetical protein HCU64_00105 [Methylobacterium sp. C25]|uniref:hypothetical protein n=1 Tax=Methylobacterium sp. C25 TaxID=2721622 RepID=UPI001F3B5C7D|nr:hypothetical protein [Methylobacterium sp. C25]MCE4222141.1 hypothetical protein [Methylobacterium sp. C25]